MTIGSAAPGWKPAAMAARDSVWAASRSSPRVCDAITARRSREVPSGTVGGRMAWAKTPRSSAASHTDMARWASPTTSGTIWVCAPVTSKPSRASSDRSVSALAWSFSTRRGCSRRSSSAASAPATAGGGNAVEKISERAVLMRYCAISASQAT